MQTQSITLFLFSLLYFLIQPCTVSAQVTFTEVMNNPATNENHDEYVEIYNLTQDVVDLSSWIIADSSNQDVLIDAGYGMRLNPNGYAVILDGSYQGNSTTYDMVIPDSALIIQVDGGTIASRLSNSDNKTLFLINAAGDTVDRYRYISTFDEGFSNEKIDLMGPNETSNWAHSLVMGGTPGFRNSVAPLEVDIGFIENSVQWPELKYLTVMQNADITIKVHNLGLNSFRDTVSVRLFIDLDQDSLFSPGDIIIKDSRVSSEILPGEFLTINWQLMFEQGGLYNLVIELYNIDESNSLNNFYFLSVTVWDNSTKLHINEIKFLTQDDQAEWLELYNSSDRPVALYGWAIADERDTSRIDSFAFIRPGQYKIFASAQGLDTLYNLADSLIIVLNDLPSFNNSEDIIYLINPLGGWLEQVPYREDWLEGEQWRRPSLERINVQLDSRQEQNWGPSTAISGATPGDINTIFAPVGVDLKSRLSIDPNPFSPDGDGQDDYALINIELPTNSARIKVEIYDILGRKVRTLRDNSFSGAQTTLVWNGENNSGRRVRMGIYIVFVQILNDRKGLIKELKKTVVVAGQL